MNPLTLVKRIQQINEREATLGISDEASWHVKYKDSAYVFVGGIPFDLTEGDLLAVFAQYGEIVDVNLVRDKGTGKSKGFAFVAYEDQRSTNLAVDNLNGAQVLGRTIRVDHCSKYKKKEEEDEETQRQKREARGVCRAFQKGECNRGASCKFSHDEQRAANTGWGAEEDRRSRRANDEFEGSHRNGKQSNQLARLPESAAREGHRASDKDSKIFKGKDESMLGDRHYDRNKMKASDWDSRDAQKRPDKGKEMNFAGDRDRKSRRHDDEQMSREDRAKRDDRNLRRDGSESHRRDDRESREGGKRSDYERNASPHHRRTDDDDEQTSREDLDKRGEKRARGYNKSDPYDKERETTRGRDERRSGYDRQSPPPRRRNDEDHGGHRSHR